MTVLLLQCAVVLVGCTISTAHCRRPALPSHRSCTDWWYIREERKLVFITELFAGGSLRKYRLKHRRIDEQVIKRWAFQILQVRELYALWLLL